MLNLGNCPMFDNDWIKHTNEYIENEPSIFISKRIQLIIEILNDSISYHEDLKKGILPDIVLKESSRILKKQKRRILPLLVDLYKFEIDEHTFVENLSNKLYLEILHDIYSSNLHLFSHETSPSLLRLNPGKKVKEKEAKDSFNAYVGFLCYTYRTPPTFSIFTARLQHFQSGNIKTNAKHFLYNLRSWLLSDEFEELINTIEPLRHKCIIQNEGNVTHQEVENYIAKFVTFSAYSYAYYNFFLCRSNIHFLYYPNIFF